MPTPKPRRHPSVTVSQPRRQQDIFENCHAPGCHNIVATKYLPKSYFGPVYCILHRSLYTSEDA